MTIVSPSFPPPLTSDRIPMGDGRRMAGTQTEFADLLSVPGRDPGLGGVPQGGRDPALAVAHVFNAFGFFPAGAPVPPAPDAGEPLCTDIGDGAAADPGQASSQTRQAWVGASAQPPPCAGEAGQSQSLDTGGPAALLPVEAAPEGPAAQAQWTAAQGAARRAGALPSPGAAVPAGGPAPRQNHQFSERSARAAAAGLKAPRTPAAPGGGSTDRLAFRIGERLVELAGRLAGLTDEEKKLLVEAVNEVLRRHGLALGSVTLNGRPLAAALFAKD